LLTAQQNDRFIELLWETCQKLPSHRDKTLFIITTDHGRGIDREGWKNHGTSHPGSERIWVAAFGPGVRQGGIDTEGKFVPGKFVQAQVAATVAAALGEDFTTSSPGIHPPLPFLRAD
jgi:phosphopentomutase